MSRLERIRPEFVEFVPRTLEPGIVYISIAYSTMVHQCACGCGSKIATPLSPARWSFAYDGEAISVWPSIGNWSYACQSHYWIDCNRIKWAAKWSPDRIERNRKRDKADRLSHRESSPRGAVTSGTGHGKPVDWWRRLFRRK